MSMDVPADPRRELLRQRARLPRKLSEQVLDARLAPQLALGRKRFEQAQEQLLQAHRVVEVLLGPVSVEPLTS